MIQTRLNPITKQLIFFADAPIDYPYRISAYKSKKRVLEAKNLQRGIIDLGVYSYLVNDPSHTYPEKLINGMFALSEELPTNILLASCDYPPINFEHNIEMNYDNVSKTIENWHRFRHSKKVSQVIFTLQFAKLLDLKQVKTDIALFPEPPSNNVGIGGLCRIMGSQKEKEYFKDTLILVRQEFPNHSIHVWGASLWHIKTLRTYANSFDNSKWTRRVTKKIGNNLSCANQEERELFFNEYIKRIYPAGIEFQTSS